MFVDNVGELAHLHARDTSFALVSRAPLANMQPYRQRLGWTMPWVSSGGSDFNDDFGVTVDGRERSDSASSFATETASIAATSRRDVVSRHSAPSGRSST
jgi:predicted dithiol-disulfide oxidoreductase (DUF899 family)